MQNKFNFDKETFFQFYQNTVRKIMGILENLGIKMFFFCRAHLEKNWFQKFEIVHYVQTNGS